MLYKISTKPVFRMLYKISTKPVFRMLYKISTKPVFRMLYKILLEQINLIPNSLANSDTLNRLVALYD